MEKNTDVTEKNTEVMEKNTEVTEKSTEGDKEISPKLMQLFTSSISAALYSFKVTWLKKYKLINL